MNPLLLNRGTIIMEDNNNTNNNKRNMRSNQPGYETVITREHGTFASAGIYVDNPAFVDQTLLESVHLESTDTKDVYLYMAFDNSTKRQADYENVAVEGLLCRKCIYFISSVSVLKQQTLYLIITIIKTIVPAKMVLLLVTTF